MSDPFAFLAPADPIARLLVAHQRTDTSACHCGWAALGESHAEHVAELVRSAFHRPRGLDYRPPERAILTDLITELNAVIETRQSSHDLFRSLRKSADKAEVRLKELE